MTERQLRQTLDRAIQVLKAQAAYAEKVAAELAELRRALEDTPEDDR